MSKSLPTTTLTASSTAPAITNKKCPWWGRIGQVLTIYKEDIRKRLNHAIIEA
jgi:hypothetical protein